MKPSIRNDQICAPKILRSNQIERRQITSVMMMTIVLATLAVGLTGIGSLAA